MLKNIVTVHGCRFTVHSFFNELCNDWSICLVPMLLRGNPCKIQATGNALAIAVQPWTDNCKPWTVTKYLWTLVYAKPEFYRNPDKLLFCMSSQTLAVYKRYKIWGRKRIRAIGAAYWWKHLLLIRPKWNWNGAIPPKVIPWFLNKVIKIAWVFAPWSVAILIFLKLFFKELKCYATGNVLEFDSRGKGTV